MSVSHLRHAAITALLALSLPLAHAKEKAPRADKELAKYAGEYSGETRTKTESLSQSEMQEYALKHHGMTLSLGSDGSATLTQSPHGDDEVTSFGTFKVSGGQLVVTFDSSPGGDTPAPMTFSTGHNELTAVNYDHNLWGRTPPPPLHRGAEVPPSAGRR